MTDGLWKFVNEYKKGTFVAQVSAENLQDAVQIYIKCELPTVMKLAKSKPYTIENSEEWGAAASLDGLKSVFCHTWYDKKNKPMLINILKTAVDRTE